MLSKTDWSTFLEYKLTKKFIGTRFGVKKAESDSDLAKKFRSRPDLDPQHWE
jgi:hypothetical protein